MQARQWCDQKASKGRKEERNNERRAKTNGEGGNGTDRQLERKIDTQTDRKTKLADTHGSLRKGG